MDLIWLQIYFIATRKIVALFCGAVLKSDGLFDYILVEDLGLFFLVHCLFIGSIIVDFIYVALRFDFGL